MSLFERHLDFWGAENGSLRSPLPGIAEHYIGASISLAGVILDLSLPLNGLRSNTSVSGRHLPALS
jgi:hypothetical protein